MVLITASYRQQEFVRVGYYVNNEYDEQELKDNPPAEPQFNKLVRTIAADQPRVTKFKINWDSPTAPGQEEGQATAGQDSEMIDDSSNAVLNKNAEISQDQTKILSNNEGLVFEQ